MKNLALFSVLVALLFSCEKGQERTSLFNGQDFSGWHIDIPAMDTSDIDSPFSIKDGSIITSGTPGGHLITDKIYKNYRLEVTYRFLGEPGNCGVLVHASTPRALYKMFPQSIEVQMMHENAGDFWVIREDIKVPDMEERRGPVEEWGTSEGKKRRILNLTDGSEKAPGEWNKLVIECFEREIKVWVNDDFVNYGYDCTVSEGQIALQSEGSAVEFKEVFITDISEISK